MVADADEFDSGDLYAEMESWMILAHVAGYPFLLQSQDGTSIGRADPEVLQEIGMAPMALRRPVSDLDTNSVPTHHIDGHGAIVCHVAGIVEPVTFSLMKFLVSETENAEEWIDEAIARKSLPLLARIDIALLAIAEQGETPVAIWARTMRETKTKPAFKELPPLH